MLAIIEHGDQSSALVCMQVLFAGGAGEPCSGSKTPASSSSYLINLAPGASHALVNETLAFPRVVRPQANHWKLCQLKYVSCTTLVLQCGHPGSLS